MRLSHPLAIHIQLDEACVYRCLDKHNRVLYVGFTRGLKRRITSHRSRADWFADVARVEFDVASASIAEWLERWEIARHRPPNNFLWNPDVDPNHPYSGSALQSAVA